MSWSSDFCSEDSLLSPLLSFAAHTLCLHEALNVALNVFPPVEQGNLMGQLAVCMGSATGHTWCVSGGTRGED